MSIHTPSRWRVAALAALMAGALPSLALSASTATDKDKLIELQKKLDQSIHMIDALAGRVRELEARQAAVAAAPPVAATPAAAPATAEPAAAAADQRISAVEQKVSQIETANATRHSDDSGLPLHGFADVGVGNRNPYFPTYKGFYIDNLDFYLTPHLGEHTRALFELNNEVGADGSVGIDLERAQIGYQFSDRATVWIGRFHTPYGFVNTAVHHGAWINDALRRPAFLQFEDHGGILPAHTVGLWLTGSEHAAAGRLQYDGYVGNSQLIEGGVVDMRNAGNAHGKLIVGGRLGYQFEGGSLDGLTAGVHAFSASRIEDDLPIPNATRVTAYGGYLTYDSDQWEHNAEVYFFDDEDLSGTTGSHHSNAEYVQFGYRVSWGVPYVRFERTDLDQTDEYFLQQISGGSYQRAALGTRFDLDSRSSIKLELAETHLTDRSRERFAEEQFQYAIRF